MLDLNDITQILANTFFSGNTDIAGMVIFTIALAIVFIFVKKVFAALVISLPLAFIFSSLGIVSQELMILLVIVAVLGLAFTSRKIWSDD